MSTMDKIASPINAVDVQKEWQVPHNETAKWRFVANPEASDQHAEIARMFWLINTDTRAVHFTYAEVELAERFGISVPKIRKIQNTTGVLQPPVNTNCVRGCRNQQLNWLRVQSRAEFKAFVRRVYCCNECIREATRVAAATKAKASSNILILTDEDKKFLTDVGVMV